MDDKVYSLMEKMYVEFNNFRSEVTSRFDNLEKGQLKLENYAVDNIKALGDSYKVLHESDIRIESKLDTLNEQVGVHEVQIRLLKKVVE